MAVIYVCGVLLLLCVFWQGVSWIAHDHAVQISAVTLLALYASYAAIKWKREKSRVASIGRLAFVIGFLTALWGVILCVVYSAVVLIGHWSAIKSLSDVAAILLNFGSAAHSTQLAKVLVMIGTWFGPVVVLMATVETLKQPTKSAPRQLHRRGQELISFSEAKVRADALVRGSSEMLINWGGLWLPMSQGNTHFCVTGATGSGKTLLISLLMQSVLSRVGEGKEVRAVVYDAKQEILSTVAAIAPNAPIYTLNPFDRRCVAWDMARDVTSPATAQQIATILIPDDEQKGPNSFFSDAARALLTGVLVSFLQTAGERWTFRDVVFVLRSASRLKEVLARTSETRDLIEQFFANERTGHDVISTVSTKMQRYQYIAAAWDRADEKISLREWLDGECILVLGNDETMRSALDAVNQVIFKRLSELILAESDSSNRRTWLFLDEVREAGKLDGLSRLLTKGRSKGACVVLGFQDIEGLRHVYGGHVAEELTGQCWNKAVLRCGSPETAKWASSLFSEREIYETSVNAGSSNQESYASGRSSSSTSTGTSSGTSTQIVKRELVLPGELQALPPTNLDSGMTGYYITPTIGSYKAHLPGEYLRQTLAAKDPDVPNVAPRAESAQFLRPWSADDLERLSFEGATAAANVIEEGSLEGIGR